jgi:hypothetical protein
MAWVANGTPLSVRIALGSPYSRNARSKTGRAVVKKRSDSRYFSRPLAVDRAQQTARASRAKEKSSGSFRVRGEGSSVVGVFRL